MNEKQLNPRLVTIIAICVMLAIFVAYMIFLTYTWQQVQRDRSIKVAKFDAAVDKAVSDGKSDE